MQHTIITNLKTKKLNRSNNKKHKFHNFSVKRFKNLCTPCINLTTLLSTQKPTNQSYKFFDVIPSHFSLIFSILYQAPKLLQESKI